MEDRMKWTLRALMGVAAVSVLALAVVGASSLWSSRAQDRSEVGWIDDSALVNDYLVAKASAEIALVNQETARLQAQFDRERLGLNEAEAEQLFYQYQARLEAYRQELYGPYLEELRAAIEQVAEEHGVSVVLNQQVVLWGGVDLNEPVRQLVGLD